MGSPLAGMSQDIPYAVPNGYFAQFDADILATIKEINKEEAVYEDGKAMPYGDIPAGYFENLPEVMLGLAKAGDVQKPRVITIAPKLKRRAIAMQSIRWAAAAMLFIATGLGAYKLVNRNKESGTDKLLSSVPSNELQDYLQNNYRLDIDRVVNNNSLMDMPLDNKDIIKYLDETGWDVVD